MNSALKWFLTCVLLCFVGQWLIRTSRKAGYQELLGIALYCAGLLLAIVLGVGVL